MASDYDLIVIGEYGEKRMPERMLELSIALDEKVLDLEVLPFTREEYETKFLFRKAVEKEGIVLYERTHK